MLQVKNLNIEINGKLIVSNFNLLLQKGQGVKYLVGKNGSGKTLILNAICGSGDIKSGQILIDNNIFYEKGSCQNFNVYKNEIAYFAHKNPIFLNLTVKQNIKIWQGYFKEKGFEDIFSIEKFFNYKVGEISKGWQAKLSLSIFFIKKANYFFMDEPFVNLDKESVDVLQSYIANSSKAFLITTHENIGLNSSAIFI